MASFAAPAGAAPSLSAATAAALTAVAGIAAELTAGDAGTAPGNARLFTTLNGAITALRKLEERSALGAGGGAGATAGMLPLAVLEHLSDGDAPNPELLLQARLDELVEADAAPRVRAAALRSLADALERSRAARR
jgi:hypothetical protein